jgi:hypothetical protein
MKTFLYHGQPFGSVAELVEHISYEMEMASLVDSVGGDQ